MKIRVELLVDLADPAEWTLAFGISGDFEIRRDVKEYVVNSLVADCGVFGDGEVEADIKLAN